MERYTPKKRLAVDGRLWWCIYDNKRNTWSTNTSHGRYKTKKAAQWRIDNTPA